MRFLSGKRPVPALGQFEFPPHGSLRRLRRGRDCRQAGDGFPVPANDHLFAILDEVQEMGGLRFGFLNADLDHPYPILG